MAEKKAGRKKVQTIIDVSPKEYVTDRGQCNFLYFDSAINNVRTERIPEANSHLACFFCAGLNVDQRKIGQQCYTFEVVACQTREIGAKSARLMVTDAVQLFAMSEEAFLDNIGQRQIRTIYDSSMNTYYRQALPRSSITTISEHRFSMSLPMYMLFR